MQVYVLDSTQLGGSMKGPKLQWHVHMKQREGPISSTAPHWTIVTI